MKQGIHKIGVKAVRVGQDASKKASGRKTKQPPKGEQLSDIIREAKEAGMSYGEYTAMQYEKRQKLQAMQPPEKQKQAMGRYYSGRTPKAHVCVDCGRTFYATANNAIRCEECRYEWGREYRRQHYHDKRYGGE